MLLRKLLPVFALLWGLLLFLPAQCQTLLRQWKSAEGQVSITLNDNILGKSFLYNRDTLLLSGKWKQENNRLHFTPLALNGLKLTQMPNAAPPAAASQTDTTVASNGTQADTIISPPRVMDWYGLPEWGAIENLTDNSLTLSNAGVPMVFTYRDNSSFFTKLINNNLLRGIIGIFSLILICFLFSTNRKNISWRLVFSGIGIQILFALLVLKVPPLVVNIGSAAIDLSPRAIFQAVAGFFVAVLDFTTQGATFVFGDLVTRTDTFGFIFAFKVLPTVVFFSALSSALYYLGILQKIVYVFAWVMSRTMRLSGAESLAAAANIFIGQTEAPLVVKPYIERMTRSELLCLMVGGMATIAGGVFAAYVGFLGGDDPAKQLLFATHLLSASIMSAPAAIVAAKMLFPETENIDTNLHISKDKLGSNLLDAITGGTTDGLRLAVNVGAMLLVFIAMMAMLNAILFDLIGKPTGLNSWIAAISHGKYAGLRLEYIFGFMFAPLAWLCGTPTADIVAVGQLLGEKTIINEFVAYGTLGNMKDLGLITNSKSLIIAIYALCGFSNFGSIGIQLGGIGALAPGQRHHLAHLGLYALLGGTIACLFTAVIAGMIAG